MLPEYLSHCLLLLLTATNCVASANDAYAEAEVAANVAKSGKVELPSPFLAVRKRHRSDFIDVLKHPLNYDVDINTDNNDDKKEPDDGENHDDRLSHSPHSIERRGGRRSRQRTLMDVAVEASAREGLKAVVEFYAKTEPNILRNGQLLAANHPASMLSKFSAPLEETEDREMAALATIVATKALKKNYKQFSYLGRQAHTPKISLRRTALEGLCPPRDAPICMPASERYRTHDGTCNNKRRLRWGAAQMPFNRFLPPEYGDGVDTIRNSVDGMPLSSSRFVSLVVHGAKDGDAPLTLMTAQWGQLLDHDMTSTAQPRSINGSVPSCCGGKDFHPSCFPIKVPQDDPWLAPLKVRCLEFLRSAPAQRRDCVLSWREQTNQATSYIDASPIYSSSAKSSDNSRVFRNGLLVFGRNAADDVCKRGAIATQCIRSGDGRSGEQPGLLALHHVWVGEHNRIAMELSEMNLHWSDEKIYQETRRIIGAMFQHITYREFLPIIVGREVCKLFELDLKSAGYYEGYNPKTNPSVANSFAAAAFRFGHSLIQSSYIRCDRHHNRISSNISLHEEFQRGDIGSAGSLHRLLRGLATQRALKRDEFISPELTNHLFQTPGFPFGLDLAAINIQRGRDHGIPAYTAWRVPCGLTPINTWDDFAKVVDPGSAKRIGHAYSSVHDIDLFVGGISERPVVGGLVGPTFACIIAQQFSNSRKGDRFWYENGGFESSFTPAQLHSIRQVSLAQVLCRSVGGGTFQPHIFIPHEFPGNDRLPCGIGPLAPLDLSPWLEQDPFKPSFETTAPDRVFDIISNANALSQVLTENGTEFNNLLHALPNVDLGLQQHTPHVDFIPNSSTGFQRPQNASKVNDKLDFTSRPTSTKRPTQRPLLGINNKLDKGPKITVNIKSIHRGHRRPQSTTRRTVIVNNIPIELRTASSEGTTKPNTERNTDLNSTVDEDSARTTTTAEVKKSLSERDSSRRKNKTIVNKWTQEENKSRSLKDDTILDDERLSLENRIPNDCRDLTNSEERVTQNETNKYDAEINTENCSDRLTTPDAKQTRVTDTELNMTSIGEAISLTGPQSGDAPNGNTLDSLEPVKDIDPLSHSTSRDHKRVQRTSDDHSKNVDVFREEKAAKILITTLEVLKNHTSKLVSTATTTKRPRNTRTPRTTVRSSDLRQYHTRPIYTRPQKVVVNGPNSDQYEIEINIRQTNKSPVLTPTSSYADFTTTNNPYDYERYTNYDDFKSTTSDYGYYQHYGSTKPKPDNFAPIKRTKPPTIIYLNENDEHTTTKKPTLLQNFLSFASSGLGGIHQLVGHNSAHKEKPIYSPNGLSSNSGLTSTLVSSPHSSGSSSQFIKEPHMHPPSPIASSSYSQVGGFPGSGGAAHASSSAVSSGNFGSIVGAASANGADSTFSFNIRPRPVATPIVADAEHPNSGSYGFEPPRRPPYAQTSRPEHINWSNEHFYEQPIREPSHSPFSSAHIRPSQESHFNRAQIELQHMEGSSNRIRKPTSHKVDMNNYDYLSKNIEPETNIKRNNDETDADGYDEDGSNEKSETLYDDDDGESYEPSRRFDQDGYLRPEHMMDSLSRNQPTSTTKANNTNTTTATMATFLDDNFVLPALNSTKTALMDLPFPMKPLTDFNNATTTAEELPGVMAKKLNNDVFSEDDDYDDDMTTESLDYFVISKTLPQNLVTATESTNPSQNVAFAPITVLTKPERPDNWVFYDSPVKTAVLPELPEIMGDTFSAEEVPIPFADLSNVRLKKFRNKLLKARDTKTKTLVSKLFKSETEDTRSGINDRLDNIATRTVETANIGDCLEMNVDASKTGTSNKDLAKTDIPCRNRTTTKLTNTIEYVSRE